MKRAIVVLFSLFMLFSCSSNSQEKIAECDWGSRDTITIEEEILESGEKKGIAVIKCDDLLVMFPLKVHSQCSKKNCYAGYSLDFFPYALDVTGKKWTLQFGMGGSVKWINWNGIYSAEFLYTNTIRTLCQVGKNSFKRCRYPG